MTWKLFLDDERYPTDVYRSADKWHIARNARDALWMIENYGMPTHMSLDHDLGDTKAMTGHDFVRELIDYILDKDTGVPKIDIFVHSMNPVGKKNMEMLWNSFVNEFG